MKGKTILIAFLVAVLVFVGVGSVAIGDAAIPEKGGARVRRTASLKCRAHGDDDFSAKAVIWWTHQGVPIGRRTRIRCAGTHAERKYTKVPCGADDFHLTIVIKSHGIKKTCEDFQVFDPESPPTEYKKGCRFRYSWTRAKAIFKLF